MRCLAEHTTCQVFRLLRRRRYPGSYPPTPTTRPVLCAPSLLTFKIFRESAHFATASLASDASSSPDVPCTEIPAAAESPVRCTAGPPGTFCTADPPGPSGTVAWNAHKIGALQEAQTARCVLRKGFRSLKAFRRHAKLRAKVRDGARFIEKMLSSVQWLGALQGV